MSVADGDHRAADRKSALCADTVQYDIIQYSTTLLPSVSTLIAGGMFCGAKYTHHTFTPIIKHLITTTANINILVKSHSEMKT